MGHHTVTLFILCECDPHSHCGQRKFSIITESQITTLCAFVVKQNTFIASIIVLFDKNGGYTKCSKLNIYKKKSRIEQREEKTRKRGRIQV